VTAPRKIVSTVAAEEQLDISELYLEPGHRQALEKGDGLLLTPSPLSSLPTGENKGKLVNSHGRPFLEVEGVVPISIAIQNYHLSGNIQFHCAWMAGQLLH
jgi:hypothetical protein